MSLEDKNLNSSLNNFIIVTNYNYSFLVRKEKGTLYLSPRVKKKQLLLAFYFAFLLKFDECIECIESVEIRNQFKHFIDKIRNGFPSQIDDSLTFSPDRSYGGASGNGDRGGNGKGGRRSHGGGGEGGGHRMSKKRKSSEPHHSQQGQKSSKRCLLNQLNDCMNAMNRQEN